MRYKKILFILSVILIAAFSGQAFSASYTYDNLNRLISVDYGNGTVANFTYDPAGNMTSMAATTSLSGSIAINGGAVSTTSTSVTLTLSATDTLSTVSQTRFSNDNTTWSAWETFATTKAWTLTSGDGVKTVYFQFNDAAGRVSPVISATITLNTVIDLTVSTVTAPANVVGGSTISVQNTVSNTGTAPSVASTANFYLSTTTSVDSTSVLLGTRAVGSIAAGGSDTATTSLTVPASTAVGTYYVVALADATNANQESNKNNNTGASAAISVTSGIDLTVSSISAPASAPQGGNITVPNTISNIGTVASLASTANFYLSTTTSVNQNSVLLGQRSVASIAAGGGDTASTTLTIPASTALGTYYIVAVADATNTNPESNESNNRYGYPYSTFNSEGGLTALPTDKTKMASIPGGPPCCYSRKLNLGHYVCRTVW